MKYSLDIHIITNNQTIINTLKTAVPAKLDATVWPNEYTVGDGIGLDGNKFLSVIVRFHTIPNRQTVRDRIQARLTPTILAQILTGSYMKYHNCNHDEAGKTTGCVETWIWRK